MSAADANADAAGRAAVAYWQPQIRDWLLMYSLSKRALVAFYRGHCPPPGLYVEAGHPEELRAKMNAEVLALWCSPDRHAWQPATTTGPR
ncbi:hypothetical protein ACFQYP_62330 [Nonomuraea antimicrobica]